jgi:hypothetical protein
MMIKSERGKGYIINNNNNMSDNLADRAFNGNLTVSDIKNADIKKLMEDKDYAGFTVLCWASHNCSTEVVEAILDRGIPVNQLSSVNVYM